MKNINIYSKNEIERIVYLKIKKALDFRLINLEKAVDKLRLRLNDLDVVSKIYKK